MANLDITVDIGKSLALAKGILLSPKKSINSLKKVDSWKSTFSFLIVIVAVGHILTAAYNFFVYPLLLPSFSRMLGISAEFNSAQILPAILISYVLTIAMSFIWGGALKIWLSLFKVDSSFAEAYKIMVYSRVPNYLLSWLPFVNLIAAFYSFYLMMLALESEYDLPRRKAITIILTSTLAIILVSFLIVSFLPNI